MLEKKKSQVSPMSLLPRIKILCSLNFCPCLIVSGPFPIIIT
jgi:hypothetical protein